MTQAKRDVATEVGSKTFIGGAKRSSEAFYYHLIPTEFLRRVAKRYTDGAKKYSADNWRAGLDNELFVSQMYNHLQSHMLDFLDDGSEYDDNLAAMGWAIAGLMEVERQVGPEMFREIFQASQKKFSYDKKGVLRNERNPR